MKKILAVFCLMSIPLSAMANDTLLQYVGEHYSADRFCKADVQVNVENAVFSVSYTCRVSDGANSWHDDTFAEVYQFDSVKKIWKNTNGENCSSSLNLLSNGSFTTSNEPCIVNSTFLYLKGHAKLKAGPPSPPPESHCDLDPQLCVLPD
jgi:hypothetical protein